MLNCNDIEIELSAYRDGALPPHERANVEAHVAACPACQTTLCAIESARTALSSLPRLKSPLALKSKIRSQIETESRIKPTSHIPISKIARGPRERIFAMRNSLFWAGGLAAALAIALLGYVTYFVPHTGGSAEPTMIGLKEKAGVDLKNAAKPNERRGETVSDDARKEVGDAALQSASKSPAAAAKPVVPKSPPALGAPKYASDEKAIAKAKNAPEALGVTAEEKAGADPKPVASDAFKDSKRQVEQQQAINRNANKLAASVSPSAPAAVAPKAPQPAAPMAPQPGGVVTHAAAANAPKPASQNGSAASALEAKPGESKGGLGAGSGLAGGGGVGSGGGGGSGATPGGKPSEIDKSGKSDKAGEGIAKEGFDKQRKATDRDNSGSSEKDVSKREAESRPDVTLPSADKTAELKPSNDPAGFGGQVMLNEAAKKLPTPGDAAPDFKSAGDAGKKQENAPRPTAPAKPAPFSVAEEPLKKQDAKPADAAIKDGADRPFKRALSEGENARPRSEERLKEDRMKTADDEAAGATAKAPSKAKEDLLRARKDGEFDAMPTDKAMREMASPAAKQAAGRAYVKEVQTLVLRLRNAAGFDEVQRVITLNNAVAAAVALPELDKKPDAPVEHKTIYTLTVDASRRDALVKGLMALNADPGIGGPDDAKKLDLRPSLDQSVKPPIVQYNDEKKDAPAPVAPEKKVDAARSMIDPPAQRAGEPDRGEKVTLRLEVIESEILDK